MDMRELMQLDLEHQERMIKRYRQELKDLPKGTLYVKSNKDKPEYYIIDKKTGKRKYIKKEKEHLIDGLKKRRFMEKSLKLMEANIETQKKFLKMYNPYDYASVTQNIPMAYRLDSSPKNAGKQTMKHYENEILHETTLGISVRSKGEAIICEALASNGIDFEYEKELILFKDGDYITTRPDFSFENIITEEWFYWEHFGMLADENYRRKNIEKLILYAENDIIIGKNLFVTADSLKGEIDLRMVMRTIELIKQLI